MIEIPGIAPDFLGSIVGFILTLMVFSYVFSSEGLFRVAVNILVGVSAGFVVIIALHNVIWPQLVYPFLGDNFSGEWLLLVPVILSLLLISKALPKISGLGSPVLAFLVGVGSAAALGGALLGTFVPQVLASINQVDWPSVRPVVGSSWMRVTNGFIFLIGTISVLVYFQFSTYSFGKTSNRRLAGIEWLAGIGKFFITIFLGVVFAGVLQATLAALVERWDFLYNFLLSFF